ncbi:hypothetical protein K5X82_05975 [Halosquirtibacter xylanolyticus]|uniref:hypothetical protein n=1 Tax=Halosquirtibacter xylanolyticus TaxID=3374599 RepID=UPI003748EF09|nr:hypothetical protein K5X82_05975 [Prolixibacteraceae bacterium]
MSHSSCCGGFTPYSKDIPMDALDAFHEAMEGFVGVGYEPLCYASQVVQGTNYCFFCNATLVVADPVVYPAFVEVFKPLEGKACITHISKGKH